MKPLNRQEPGCNFTTSNCVIWQGPDITCLNLCKGDTVSDVVYKLATELCEVLDILSLTNYDLSCFGLGKAEPVDFKGLITFILDKLCELQGGPVTPGPIGTTNPDVSTQNGNLRVGATGGCPDCVVSIAPCFYYKNAFGDTVTSMQLIDYATAIGNKVCNNVDQILQLQNIVANHELRIAALESAPAPVFVTPQIVPTCVLPSVLTDIDIVLDALEQQFCDLRTATGEPPAIYSNLAKQPAGLTFDQALSNPSITMGSFTGWTNVVTNVAETLGNMWITIADLRLAVRTIQLNCCPTGCDGIALSLTATYSADVLTIYVSGTIPAGFVQCSGTTTVKVTDSAGNSIQFNYDLISYLNNPTGYPFNLSGTPINSSLDLTIDITPCLYNSSTNATCESCLNYYIVNEASCPAVTWTQGSNSISYSFISQAGDWTYTVEVWDSAGSTMIANQTQAISGVQTVTGEVIGLSPATIYKVRLTIVATACDECQPKECQFTNVTTNLAPCPPPPGVSAGITIDIIL